MPASFPNSIKTWADKQDNIDDVFASDVNNLYAEIIAVETELIQVGYKKSARVATTQNGTLATAFANGQTVDGIVLATGDRILIKNQASGTENGIYVVNASGAPTRAVDANSSIHMVAGLMIYVREGTVNAKGTWKLTTTAVITLGTTPLTFENEVMAHKADNATQIANIKNKIGMIVESVNLDDCVDMKSLGVGYVIYFYHPNIGLVNGLQQVRYFAQVGINVIVSLVYSATLEELTTVSNNFKDEPNVIGWYLYDEVDASLVALADQETKIQNVKTLSGLPCTTSCNSNFTVSRKISLNFDIYFTSIYLTDTQIATTTDITDLKVLFLLPHNSIGALVGLDKCIPIVQAFADATHSVGTVAYMENLYKAVLSVSKNSPCFFIYSANVTNPVFTKTIKSDVSLKSIVKKFINICNNGFIPHENIILKTTIYDDFGTVLPVPDYLANVFQFVDNELSVGTINTNPLYPTTAAYNGFYPTLAGSRLVVDLGCKVKHLNFRITAKNIKNANGITLKIDKLFSPNEGTNIYTSTSLATIQVNITIKNLNSRYISIYITDALDSTYDHYIFFNNILYIGIA